VKYRIGTGHLRALTRSAVAFACTVVLATGALPALNGTAVAKEKPLAPGKRCDELYKLSDVRPGRLPSGDTSRPKSQWDEFDYTNPGKQYDGLELPADPAERADFLKTIGTDPDAYDKGDPRRVYAYYAKEIAKPSSKWKTDWDGWRDGKYIPQSGHDPRGKAFEAKVVKDFGLVGPDWICQKEIEVKDPKTGKVHRRILDAINEKTREIVEIKSNNKPEDSQKPKDLALSRDKKWQQSGYKMRFVFAEERGGNGQKFFNEMRQNLGKDALGRERVTIHEHRSNAIEKAPAKANNSPHRYNAPYMNADPSKSSGSRGGAVDQIKQSKPTPKDMADFLNRREQASGGRFPKGPGGIDFTSLDLKYVGKPVKGEGLDYAFSAKKAPDESGGWGGKEKAQMISDAFFTWLALTPDKFWVNLNPDTPGTIMDDKFASTDAGRVLLEADLQLKHDFYKAMDPKTEVGKAAWDGLAKVNGWPCLNSGRNWIEPKTAKVREQDGGIYILDAPLKLQSAFAEVNTPGPGGGESCQDHLSKDEIDHNESVLRRTVVPEVEKWINTKPEYADLRRVYTARVAAEWIRQQDAQQPTDYRKIINSNDVKRWPLRAPHQDWKKTDVFDRYVKIFKEGEFKYELTKGEEVWVISVGGVDFSKQPKHNITRRQFRAENPYTPRTKDTAVKAATDDADRDGMLMLGGNSVGKSDDGGDTPTPTPTPTSTGGGEPTPTPTGGGEPTPTGNPSSTPAPSHSHTGGGNKPPADPDGDLADTGSNTPVGLIAGIATAALAAGATMVWWMRRRRTSSS
jgi:LPXTG-motif cell wall-anchored protein